ncbi:FecR family protein [Dinghuibacter silviterrae]|uniref:Ferric-dicitrate binding protein FerR (Iron transport regulator) n=1 Tax=Dinghuibacter silviterrae TaxID=1539049 RepID=A0A4R8DXS2_9BACT|nr:FecR family protein [Dinghuibacter silviterrae]TDX02237.1 ferric-dicitrate binding protein FerR (iron transport regulator) [Dinghuibacter silviterrae]
MLAESIIRKYLSGAATPDEAAKVEEWIDASPEHRRAFEQVWHEWQALLGKGDYRAPDVAGEWKAWRTKHGPAPFPKGAAFGMYAAVLIIAGVTGVVVYKHTAPARAVVVRDSTLFDANRTIDMRKNDTGYQARPGATLASGVVSGGPTGGDAGASSTLKSANGASTAPKSNAGERAAGAPGAAVSVNGRSYAGGASPAAVSMRHRHTTHSMDKPVPPVLTYADAPLPKVLESLSKTYGVRFVVRNPQLLRCRVTTQFDHKPLHYILDVLAATLQIQYYFDHEKQTIQLSGEGSN